MVKAMGSRFEVIIERPHPVGDRLWIQSAITVGSKSAILLLDSMDGFPLHVVGEETRHLIHILIKIIGVRLRQELQPLGYGE